MDKNLIREIQHNEKYFEKSDWKNEQKKIIGKFIKNNEINHEIITNAEQNKFDRVFELIKKGGDVNAKSYYPHHETPIMHAIKKSNSNTVKKLISMGADLSVIRNHENMNTILIDAIYSLRFNETNFEIVRAIAKKCDVNQPNKNGTTPLMIASGINLGVEVIDMLVSMGANINMENHEGINALTFAVRAREKEVIKRLIELGADKNNVLNDYETLQSLYEDYCEREIMNIIKNTRPITKKEKDEFFENFIDFVRSNDVEKVKNMIKRIDVNEKDENNWTPLIYAVIEGNLEIVKTLIKNNADLNVADEEGWTPLMLAIKEKHNDIIRELIKKGADVNIENTYGITAIMLAVNNEEEEIVKLLVDNKTTL